VEERVVLLAALKPGARERALEPIEEAADRQDHDAVTERQSVVLSDLEFFERRGD
jgi:hypothetical protein